LCDDVELVLVRCEKQPYRYAIGKSHLGFEPVDKGDNVRVLKLLQHLQLVIDHALISADVLLEDNLDRNLLAILGLSLTDDTVSTCTERTPELVQGSVRRMS